MVIRAVDPNHDRETIGLAIVSAKPSAKTSSRLSRRLTKTSPWQGLPATERCPNDDHPKVGTTCLAKDDHPKDGATCLTKDDRQRDERQARNSPPEDRPEVGVTCVAEDGR